MCTDIFIGVRSSDIDLTMDGSETGLRIRPLPAENKLVRELIELDNVFDVGSFMGCTCGLAFGEGYENHERRVANVVHLQRILKQHADNVVRILTLETYDFVGLEEVPRRVLDLRSMDKSVSEFGFDADHVYELWPPASPGPHDLESIFPPRTISQSEIKGTAPEVGDYWNSFANRKWNEASEEEYSVHGDVFTLMESESLCHILPGILMTCMNCHGCQLYERFLFFVQRPKFVELHQLLATDAQKLFLIQMTDFLIRFWDDEDEVSIGYAANRKLCLEV